MYSWFVGVHWSWVCIAHGCISIGGTYQLGVGSLLAVGAHHAWVGGCCVCAHSSFMEGCYCLWVVGRGVVLVPGCCHMGVVCGCWVLLVGIGCTLWVLGIVCGHWVICRLWVVGVGAPSCAVHLIFP